MSEGERLGGKREGAPFATDPPLEAALARVVHSSLAEAFIMASCALTCAARDAMESIACF